MLLLDTNILIDVLRGEAPALAWLEQQQRPRISVISWIEVLVGCREGESADLSLATRNSRDFPLTLGGVLHPYGI
jgi:predicted nucleic acid-binding protein